MDLVCIECLQPFMAELKPEEGMHVGESIGVMCPHCETTMIVEVRNFPMPNPGEIVIPRRVREVKE